MIWFSWIIWHINYCRLFKDKYYYTYISNAHDMVELDFMAYQTL